jgi:UPF0755 protein
MSQLGLEMTSHDDRPGRRGGRSSRSGSGRAVLLAFVALVLVIVSVGYFGIKAVTGGNNDYQGEGSGSVLIVVAKGDALRTIASKLADAGVVASSNSFLDATAGNAKAASISPGTYRLREGMSGAAALTLILSPSARDGSKLVIPEGRRATQIVAAAAKSTGLSAAALNASLANASALGLPKSGQGNPEGYLFPATYDFSPGVSADTVVSTMIARYLKAELDLGLDARAQEMGITVQQLLTVASILEVEASPADYAKVAQVIYNRLKIGKSLQLDSTVNYGLGTFDLHLTKSQLQSDTPYNTYLHKGLPPGPIGSPGAAALTAAMNPAPGTWIYFVTTDVKQGITKFTASYAEFVKFKAEFLRNSGG